MNRSHFKWSDPALAAIVAGGIVLIMVIGCAEVGAPPGGEVDRTGPRVVESFPANGALGVEVGYQIRLLFSENIAKPDQGNALFISPRPSTAPDIKWKSKEIIVNLAEAFRPNQTYVISISTAITDLRRNRMDSAVTIAFTTGQTIDSGLIAGKVLTADSKPAVGWIVGLYPLGTFDNYHLADSVHPAYMTTASKDGQFALLHLPATGYDLIAFEDKNRDEFFNPAVESFALPDRVTTVGADLKLDRLILAGTFYDSLAPVIISAVATKDHLLRLRLNRKIDPSFLVQHYQETTLRSLSDTGAAAQSCQGIAEARLDNTDVITAYFPDLTDDLYRFSMAYQAGLEPLVRDSVAFKLLKDDVAPTISSFLPGDKPIFVNQTEIALTFSEPIRQEYLTPQTFVLWAGDVTTPVRLVWPDPFHLTLQPSKLAAGTKYRVSVTEFEIRDLADNALGDSLRSYNFATLNDDSVGSISGQVVIRLPHKTEERAQLTFSEVGSKRQFTTEAAPSGKAGAVKGQRDFSLSVPPGKYLLSGFLDSNGDRKFTPGSIRPYRLAETEAFYADTIAVRARFETAGIEFIFE